PWAAFVVPNLLLLAAFGCAGGDYSLGGNDPSAAPAEKEPGPAAATANEGPPSGSSPLIVVGAMGNVNAPPGSGGEHLSTWSALGGSELSPWKVRPNGSATAGGISRSAGSSSMPFVLFDALDRPVLSWVESVWSTVTETWSATPRIQRWNAAQS